METVFEEPEPDDGSFSPGTTSVSVGYGQRHEQIFLDESDTLEAKIGIRVQRRWGNHLAESERDIHTGVELRVRYDNTIKDGIEWYLEAETFAPFDDLGHLTNWAEIGIDIAITDWITASLSARAYYETRPDDVTTGDGYDELSMRQTALIGLTWTL